MSAQRAFESSVAEQHRERKGRLWVCARLDHGSLELGQVRLLDVLHRNLEVVRAAREAFRAAVFAAGILDGVDRVVLERADGLGVAGVVAPLQALGIGDAVLPGVERILGRDLDVAPPARVAVDVPAVTRVVMSAIHS